MKKYKVVNAISEDGDVMEWACDLVNVDDSSDRLMAAEDEFNVGEIVDESEIEMKMNSFIDIMGVFGEYEFAFRK